MGTHFEKPWGHYESLQFGHRYQVKRLLINSGQATSLQKHYLREEVWVIVQGTAEITTGYDLDNLEVEMYPEGSCIRIPIGGIHRVANPGMTKLCIIETMYGPTIDEDDIVRLADNYGREI